MDWSKFGAEIDDSKTMYPNDVGDALAFPLVPP